jgi:gas vesicle protein
MDIGTIVVSVFAGAGVGFATASLFAANAISDLRKKVATRDRTIAAYEARIVDDTKELAQLGDRCTDLRVAGRAKDQVAEKLQRRIAELEPDAERGRKQREQSQAALRAAQQKNRERHAAKQAGNVTSIKPAHVTAPKKPTRKSALAG